MIEIQILPNDRFGELKGIFEDEFGSELPLPANSMLFIAVENDKMVGFVLAEKCMILGQLYVVPEKRNNTLSIAQNLIGFLRASFDGKATVGAVASEPRFEQLFEQFGMEKIKGTFHRKNVNYQ